MRRVSALASSRRPFALPAGSTLPLAALAVYAVAAVIALALPSPAKGWAVLVVSFGGCAALVAVTRAEALWVLVPASICQLLPDWFLAGGLGTLRFPDTGGVRVDDVIPLAMCGMWALPLYLIVVVAKDSVVRGAVAGFLVFLGTELLAPTAGLWEPAGELTKVAGVALYVLPAEAALGAAAVVAARVATAVSRPVAERVLAGAAVSVFYTGALALCWFLIDGR
jgi:hypothetical protein